MDTTAPGARAAARSLAVLAVLLGLFAMHGLASTHHAAAASTVPHAAQPDTGPAAGVEGAYHHAAEHDAAALATDTDASCEEICPEVEVLCLAVLAGAALAALLARRRSPLPLPCAPPRGPAPAPPVRHARGPDPVRDLCVSRT